MGQAVLHYGGSIDAFIDLTLNTPTYTMAYKVAAADGLTAARAQPRTRLHCLVSLGLMRTTAARGSPRGPIRHIPRRRRGGQRGGER